MAYNGPRNRPRTLPNLTSARIHSNATLSLIEKSIRRGYVSGWYPRRPFPNLFVNPVGVVPKPGADPPWRLIEDLSQPHGDSVNDWTDDMDCVYDKIDLAIEEFAKHGRGCVFIIYDKKSAYPSIYVRQQDHHLLGIYWPGKGYAFSKVMKFGAKRSAGMWECFGAVWSRLVIERTDAGNSWRWVDDSFTACSPEEAARIAEQIIKLSLRYNYTLDKGKFVVARVAKYLGVIFNSIDMSLSIPKPKREAALVELRALATLPTWTKHQLQSIIGTLFYFCYLLHQCRGFLSRLLASLKAAKGGKFKTSDWLRADVRMWIAIIENWSGTALPTVLMTRKLSSPGIRFEVDASPAFGVGIYCVTNGQWINLPFSDAQLASAWRTKEHSSTVLEAYALVAVPLCFPRLIKGQAYSVAMDARNVALGAKRGYSTTPTADDLLRLHAALQCNLNCVAIVVQIPREDNEVADALSKNDLERFRKRARERQLSPRSSASTRPSPPRWLSPITQSASLWQH